MIPQRSRNEIRQRVHKRIREKMLGTSERPRLNIYRSLNHIYAQVIDDIRGVTVVSASSLEGAKTEGGKAKEKSEGGKGKAGKTGGNVSTARDVGRIIAERAKQKGVQKVVFDRGGYLYHGRIKALADAAREAGLQF
jgi:large subunit ribosomal protein L18